MLEALMQKHISKPEYDITMYKMSIWCHYSMGYFTDFWHGGIGSMLGSMEV